MCGVFGVAGAVVDERCLLDAARAMDHRGPDGQGTYLDPDAPVGLAHARLAIIDLTTGQQPIVSMDGELILVCNGELYDHERIGAELEARGHVFRTRSDSEIAIHLYREYGLEGFAEHLRGEFALLLYDRKRRRLVACRDRFGIKPLYFARTSGGALVFASEMKALFASGLLEPTLDVSYLAEGLVATMTGVLPVAEGARFAFRGVDHVQPGEVMAIDVDSGDVARRRYWAPDLPPQGERPGFGDVEEAADAVLEALETAVRLRLRADVPVGAYLSGGVDSATVCALMQRLMERHGQGPFHVFSLSFPQGVDEAAAARRMASTLGATAHEVALNDEALWGALERSAWHVEGIAQDLSPAGKYLLSELARDHVPVVLTGEGADEVFLGYQEYRRRRSRLPPIAERLASRILLELFHPDVRASVEEAMARAWSRSEDPHTTAQTEGRAPVVQAQYRRLSAMPLGVLCALGDRAEMAHSIEARTPFLDHHLFDVARRIPAQLNLAGGLGKEVLRAAAARLLPREVTNRGKLGFSASTPDVVVLRPGSSVREALVERHLSPEAFTSAGVFSPRAFEVIRALGRIPLRTARGALVAPLRLVNFLSFAVLQVHMLHALFVRGEGPPSRTVRGP